MSFKREDRKKSIIMPMDKS